ncbi:MAG TPA: hypothetical protein VF634_11095 [Pyrinomonadaceae bacterium]
MSFCNLSRGDDFQFGVALNGKSFSRPRDAAAEVSRKATTRHGRENDGEV